MKNSLAADDVVGDIEFELVQGAISRHELGQSIQAVRRYQNKIRDEVFQSVQKSDATGRETVSRLFQINDMLITLLQATAAELQSLQLGLRKTARMSQAALTRTAIAGVGPAAETGGDIPAAVDVPALDELEEDAIWQSSTDVEDAMRSEALQIEPQVRSTGTPVVGWMIRRMRAALHSLVLFYVERLARKQTKINQTYGDWILRLVQMYHGQQEQTDVLGMQVAALQARLAEMEETSPPNR
jgi:hypothetical protein